MKGPSLEALLVTLTTRSGLTQSAFLANRPPHTMQANAARAVINGTLGGDDLE